MIGQIKVSRVEDITGICYKITFYDSMGSRPEMLTVTISQGLFSTLVNQVKHMELSNKWRR